MNEKILLVDDDPAVRRMLFRVLEGERYRVIVAANAREALESARREHPNLTVLDVNLPGDNGWELYQALANEHLLMPIMVVTAHSSRTTPMLMSGAGALLEKPLDLPKLLWTIRHFLDDTAAASVTGGGSRPSRGKPIAQER
jgi:DNA-binding response OmpR family regulator